MTVKLLVGDVRDRIREIPDGSVDLVACSPPFWNLRDYGGGSKNDAEMGSEDTPAQFLDTLLSLTAEFRRVLTPHGSIAIELGDSYFGSGGAGGDYNDNGLREGQHKFRQKRSDVLLPKSLCLIPTLYPASLAYGWNMLNPAHTFDRWRVRNVIVWARPNPPVGALGDKVRPATSYITVACTSAKRWFDLDAVREPLAEHTAKYNGGTRPTYGERGGQGTIKEMAVGAKSNEGGAPPLDWWEDDDPTGHATLILPTQPYPGAHYATWPEKLAARLILMMCPVGGMVLDPFAGSGTTLAVAQGLGRDATGIELYEANADLVRQRVGMFLDVDDAAVPTIRHGHNSTGNPRFRAGYVRNDRPTRGPQAKDYGS